MGPFASMISRIPLRNGERMFIAAPLFHAWGYATLQLAFGLRGTAVLSRRFEPSAVLDSIVANECTALVAVPVMVQRILDVPTRPTKLRIVAVSGSALPTGLPNAFMNQYGDVLYNLYGSTEVSWSSIATPKELRSSPGTAGRPPYGTVVAIVDVDNEPVPRGGTGRIFVGNEMVSDGYTHGSLGETYRGLVNTGDLGHFDQDGLLYVDGRQDDMIISGGENVYPGPVERCIAALPAVRDCVVVGVKDVELGERLVAYIVCLPGETLDESVVRDHVRATLGRFAVPKSVTFLPELPRNVTGKVLARELPPPPD
jgi:acyl-CoA synthetase (AMP-forming)/AMP-acid ligase II